MKPTTLNVSLMASTALAMVMTMSGCIFPSHDRGDDGRGKGRVEQRDNDRHDEPRGNDRHDEGRGGR